MLPMTTHILCFGNDEILLKTRRWILQQDFRVDAVSDLAAFALLVDRHRLDLVIFCQTLPLAEYQQAIDLLQTRAPGTKVLNLVTATQAVERIGLGHFFDPSNGPRAFVACVVTMLEPTVVVSGQFVAGR